MIYIHRTLEKTLFSPTFSCCFITQFLLHSHTDVFSVGFLAVQNQAFVAADDVTAAFPGSGILGLGFGAKSHIPDMPNTIFENMVEQNLVSE